MGNYSREKFFSIRRVQLVRTGRLDHACNPVEVAACASELSKQRFTVPVMTRLRNCAQRCLANVSRCGTSAGSGALTDAGDFVGGEAD